MRIHQLGLISLLSFVSPLVCGQQLQIVTSGPHNTLGLVLGATFNEKDNEFFIQDVSFQTTSGGQTVKRTISAWNLSNEETKGIPRIDEYSTTSSKYTCGRIEFVPGLHVVVACSRGSSLEFLDSISLALRNKIEVGQLGTIFDFAIDEDLNVLLVLSVSSDERIHLSSYSLKEGLQRSDLVLGSSYAVNNISIAVSPSAKVVAIATTRPEKGKSILYSCTYGKEIGCRDLGNGPPISQLAFLGRQLLFAPSSFPDDKRACIISVNLSTDARAKAYCAPQTGVHYAVGVIEERYIVGYTGLRTTNWLTENARVAESSFSLWRPANKQVQTKVSDPTKGKGFQAFHVVGSKSIPYFIAFSPSSEFTLYQIQ